MNRNMKKGIMVLVSALMILRLAACGSSAAQSGQNVGQETPVQNTVSVTDDNTQNEAASTEIQEETAAESMNTDKTKDAADHENGIKPEAVAENDSETGVQSDEDTQELNILVAYFSATNTTKGIAEHLANGLGADLYEIVPMNPYTDADLNYNDNNSRTTIEMNDPSSRPEISGSVENMGQYDVVFIGYPIWHYTAPMAVFSFIEENDLSGKKIVLFCSHGTGGLASSVKDITVALPDSDIEENVLGIYREETTDAEETVQKWLREIGY